MACCQDAQLCRVEQFRDHGRNCYSVDFMLVLL